MILNINTVEDIINENSCYFCRNYNNVTIDRSNDNLISYNCPYCGHYQITREVIYKLQLDIKFRTFASAIAQERKLAGQDDYVLQWRDIPGINNILKINIGEVPFLNNYPKNYLEKLDRILVNIGRKTSYSPLNYFRPNIYDFALFFLQPQKDYYIVDMNGMYLKCEYQIKLQIRETLHILEKLSWIEIKKSSGENRDWPLDIYITVNGLKHIQELHKTTEEKSQPFVAMWFPSEGEYVGILNNYVNSITNAIQQAGYSAPYIANRDKYNGAIMNKVINQIRESRFLIADLTCDEKSGMRGGVYYEAGLAAGLGMPVILTCHKKAQKFVHFDLKQFNTIFWDFDENGIVRADGHPEVAFSDYLAEWIIATVGKKK